MSPESTAYTFRMDPTESPVAKTNPTLVSEVTDYVNASVPISDEAAYNTFIHGITDIIAKHQSDLVVPEPVKDSPYTYESEVKLIRAKNEITFPVPWANKDGGVTFKKVDVEKNHIQKLLVVAARGILGFEYHDRKHEKLRVTQGLFIYISSIHGEEGWEEGHVTLRFAQPGDEIVFETGDEHGVIAVTNGVIEETSTNDLDDLIFIFNSEQVA